MYFMGTTHILHVKYKLIAQVFELISQLPPFEGVSVLYSYWLLSTRVKHGTYPSWILHHTESCMSPVKSSSLFAPDRGSSQPLSEKKKNKLTVRLPR